MKQQRISGLLAATVAVSALATQPTQEMEVSNSDTPHRKPTRKNPLTPKEKKVRRRNKIAKQSRKINRK